MRRVASNKLFYNKYKYHLSTVLGLAGIFRNKNLDYVRKTLDVVRLHLETDTVPQNPYQTKPYLPRWIEKGIYNEDPHPDDFPTDPVTFKLQDHVEAMAVYQALLTNPDSTVRVEYPNRLGIYSNDKEWLESIIPKVTAIEFHEPKEKFSELLDENPHVMLTTQKEYKYKILFKGYSANPNSYPEFATWCKNNKDKIRITDQSISHLEKKYNMEGRYFFIKDDKTLTLINLMIGSQLGRVYRLINKAEIDK